MEIAVIKEIAAGGMEHRAILLPREVERLVQARRKVFVEKGLGERIYIDDEKYKQAGAVVLANRKELFRKDIVVKLKPPLPKEFKLLKDNLLFSMLHAEQNPQYIKFLKERRAKAIAMELIRNRAGERLIQCTDMAGEQGMLMAFHLAKQSPQDCNVLLLGYGSVSSGALKVACGLGANVRILRKSEFKAIRHFLRGKDIVVNGIAWPKEMRDGKEYLVTKDMLKLINRGGIILDLAVDYPNPIETCRPTLINRPTYEVEGIKHICIFGYPGLVPVSSAKRYSRQVFPLLLKMSTYASLNRLPAYIRAAMIDPERYIVLENHTK